MAAGSAVAALALCATVAPAAAKDVDRATVDARGGLVVHSAPSTHTARRGTLRDGQQVETVCHASGTAVSGDADRYLVGFGTDSRGWVFGHYLDGVTSDACVDTQGTTRTGRAATAVNLRQGPSTADAATGVRYRAPESGWPAG